MGQLYVASRLARISGGSAGHAGFNLGRAAPQSRRTSDGAGAAIQRAGVDPAGPANA